VDYPDKFQGRKVKPMSGRSMVSLLDGTKKAIYNESEYVGGEMGGGKWMRQGDFKAVMVPKPYGTGQWQLFNVAKDPGEAKDLSKSIPDKLEELKAAWDDYAKEVGVVMP
jgi:arylsulfatase